MKKTPLALLKETLEVIPPRAGRSRSVRAIEGRGRASERALTGREKEILRWLSEGLTTRAVAEKLFISPVTVRNHTQRILRKLGVHSKLAAVVAAYQKKIL